MDNDPEIGVDAHRPEVRVLRAVELVERHAGRGRTDLQVECGRLGGLLLLRRKARKAISESVGDQEVHNRSETSEGDGLRQQAPRSLIASATIYRHQARSIRSFATQRPRR
jgi:hypothetical protein